MQAEKTANPEFTIKDMLALVKMACVVIVPLSIIVVFIASWVNAYQRWGSTGVLVNGFINIIVGILLYKLCNDSAGNEVDNEQVEG